MTRPIVIEQVDPLGRDAMGLLRQASIEVRTLYPESSDPDAGWPTNTPVERGSIYLVGYADGEAVGCGALRRLDDVTAEVRRVFVVPTARRRGFGKAILTALESEAHRFGYTCMRLETGDRQRAAIALYTSCGFTRIPPFGAYIDDPTRVYMEKAVKPTG